MRTHTPIIKKRTLEKIVTQWKRDEEGSEGKRCFQDDAYCGDLDEPRKAGIRCSNNVRGEGIKVLSVLGNEYVAWCVNIDRVLACGRDEEGESKRKNDMRRVSSHRYTTSTVNRLTVKSVYGRSVVCKSAVLLYYHWTAIALYSISSYPPPRFCTTTIDTSSQLTLLQCAGRA